MPQPRRGQTGPRVLQRPLRPSWFPARSFALRNRHRPSSRSKDRKWSAPARSEPPNKAGRSRCPPTVTPQSWAGMMTTQASERHGSTPPRRAECEQGPRGRRLSLRLGHGRRGKLIGSEHKRIIFKARAWSGAFVFVDSRLLRRSLACPSSVASYTIGRAPCMNVSFASGGDHETPRRRTHVESRRSPLCT